jgi:hypothetical protein
MLPAPPPAREPARLLPTPWGARGAAGLRMYVYRLEELGAPSHCGKGPRPTARLLCASPLIGAPLCATPASQARS